MNRSIVLFHSRNTELHIFDPETMASEDNPYPADLILYLLERGYTGIDINAKSLCNGLGIIFFEFNPNTPEGAITKSAVDRFRRDGIAEPFSEIEERIERAYKDGGCSNDK